VVLPKRWRRAHHHQHYSKFFWASSVAALLALHHLLQHYLYAIFYHDVTSRFLIGWRCYSIQRRRSSKRISCETTGHLDTRSDAAAAPRSSLNYLSARRPGVMDKASTAAAKDHSSCITLLKVLADLQSGWRWRYLVQG
jgi:hypothetical protein